MLDHVGLEPVIPDTFSKKGHIREHHLGLHFLSAYLKMFNDVPNYRYSKKLGDAIPYVTLILTFLFISFMPFC